MVFNDLKYLSLAADSYRLNLTARLFSIAFTVKIPKV